MTDTVIIGGGAAGLMTAVKLKEISPKSEVTVLESGDRVGKKLLVTGNGRCNISNVQLNALRYHGDSDFAERIINNFDFDEFYSKCFDVPVYQAAIMCWIWSKTKSKLGYYFCLETLGYEAGILRIEEDPNYYLNVTKEDILIIKEALIEIQDFLQDFNIRNFQF